MRIDHVVEATGMVETTGTARRTRAFVCVAGFACLILILAPVHAAPAVPAKPAVPATLAARTAPAALTTQTTQTAQAIQAAPESASTREPTPSSATAQALTHLEEETLVLKARLKALETETQIAQRSAELTRLAGAGERNGYLVRAVEGIGSAMYATLWSREDGEIEVKQGDTLPNGMRIVSIRASEVLARPEHGGKAVALPMATNGQPGLAPGQSFADTPAAGGTATGIPGIPPLPRY